MRDGIMLARPNGDNSRIRALAFAALASFGMAWVVAIAVVAGCLGARSNPDDEGGQACGGIGRNADGANDSLMIETNHAQASGHVGGDADHTNDRPVIETNHPQACDCIGCHTDEMRLMALAEPEEAPPTDTCDG